MFKHKSVPTYQELLKDAKKQGIEEDAFVLLARERLNLSRFAFYERINDKVDTKLLKDIKKLKRLPVQYILGYAYFYKSEFIVNKNVLIPRFDTEIMVDKALEEIKEKNYRDVLDLGAGCGCIGISLKKEIPSLNVVAIDKARKALQVARKNCILHDVGIKLIRNDYLKNIKQKFDLIITNPPYIAYGDKVSPLVKRNEPHLALYAKDNGMSEYKKILKNLFSCLNEKGTALFEIPDTRCEAIIDLIKQTEKDVSIDIVFDFNHLKRVLAIRRKI